MTGTLAQIIAIVTFGNAALSGQNVDVATGHSSMQFCNKVEFVQANPIGDTLKEIVDGEIAQNYSPPQIVPKPLSEAHDALKNSFCGCTTWLCFWRHGVLE